MKPNDARDEVEATVRGRLPADISGEIAIARDLVAKRRPDAELLLETLLKVQRGEITGAEARLELFVRRRRDPASKIRP